MIDPRPTLRIGSMEYLIPRKTARVRMTKVLSQSSGVMSASLPVAPPTPGYAPNRLLEVTPEFLDAALTLIAKRGFDFVTLAEGARRLGDGCGFGDLRRELEHLGRRRPARRKQQHQCGREPTPPHRRLSDLPVISMTGMSFHCTSPRIARASSGPLIRGILSSASTRSIDNR